MLPSASEHVQLGLLNILGPDYALTRSKHLRITLNIGPTFSAETSGAGGRGAIHCSRNGLLVTPPDFELMHRSCTPAVFNPSRLAVFIISRELLTDCIAEIGLRPCDVEITYQAMEQSAVLFPLAQALFADLSEGSPDGQRATDGLCRVLVSRLVARLRRNPGSAPLADPMARVCGYIDSNLQEPLGLGKLAEVANMSQFHFCRVFHQVVGKSPHQYVMSARVEAAKQLLRESSTCSAISKTSMVDVALTCGFSSSSHFSTQFRRHIGCSPMEWRANKSNRSLQT
jgi:AraC-like DNA-binding protein